MSYVTQWLLVLLLSSAITTLAVAQEPKRHALKNAIDLNPGASCLELERLIAAVEPYLSRKSIDSRIRIEVRGDRIRANVVAFRLLRSQKEYATRRIDDAPRDCEQLHELIGLTLAFAIDATWLTQNVRKSIEPIKSEDSYLKRFAIGADALGSIGVVPGLGIGGDVRVELGFLAWLDLRGSLLSVYSGRHPIEDSRGTVESLLAAARVDSCAGLSPFSWLRIRGCMGFAIGTFVTHGNNYDVRRTEGKLWMASVSGLDWLLTLSERWRLTCEIDAMFPTSRRVIQVLGPDGGVLAERPLGTVGGVGRIGLLFFFTQ